MRPLFTALIFIVLTYGCTSENKRVSGKTEGVIEYEIKYPESLNSRGVTTFLPDKMTTSIKDNNTLLKINGGFGLYSLRYISKNSGDSCYTLFKLFDKKLYYPMGPHKSLFVFNELGKPKIKLVKDSVKVIAGFNCKKAIVYFSNPGIKPVLVYYTEEIGTKKPNINTPFESIPGTMLEFNFFYKTLSFNVKAVRFTPTAIDDSEFNIPSDYKLTNEKEIEGFIETLLQ
ncbi:MAG: hypothetical protein GXO47_05555 [Chlorobi bacterium]|nr:hypothetical protein [Chlorobiota bacterium]